MFSCHVSSILYSTYRKSIYVHCAYIVCKSTSKKCSLLFTLTQFMFTFYKNKAIATLSFRSIAKKYR